MTASPQTQTRVSRRLATLVAAPLALLVVVVAVWELATSLEWISPLILPRPGELALAFLELMTGSLVWPHVWATLWETVAGFLLGAGLGIVLAVCSSLSGLLRRMFYPYVIVLQVTPRIAIAPILIAWLGFGFTPKIVVAATIVFFPVFINAMTGLLSVSPDEVEMFRSLGATRRQEFLYLRAPNALEVTFAGFKTGITLALIGAIVGEFISAETGLGLLLKRFSYQLAMPEAFAVLLVLTVLGLVLYAAAEYLDRSTVFWTRPKQLERRSQRRKAQSERIADRAKAGR